MTANGNQIVVYQPTGELVRGSTTEDFSVVRMATSESVAYPTDKSAASRSRRSGRMEEWYNIVVEMMIEQRTKGMSGFARDIPEWNVPEEGAFRMSF